MADDIIKNKCDTLLKHIFGSNFYFVHGTSTAKIEPILKSGYINISPEIDKKYWSWYSYVEPFVPIEGLDYVYCWIKYDDIKVKIEDGGYEDSSFLIDPRILLYEDVIFNTRWASDPIELTETDQHAIIVRHGISGKEWTDYNFSIHLNKSDSKEERLEKLQKIKKYIPLIHESDSKLAGYAKRYSMTHEFLFPKKINLKKYLIGLIFNGALIKKKSIKKIFKKKYKHVKIYEYKRDYTNDDNNDNYPMLMDVIC